LEQKTALGRHHEGPGFLMFHLNDRLLEKLIDGTATMIDVQRIRRHVEECRACARRLEEWRDNFTEVEEHFPELAIESGPSATVSSDGLILLPAGDQRRRFQLDLTTSMWIGVGLMAILVIYGVFRSPEPSSDFGMYMLPPLDTTLTQSAVTTLPAETIPAPDTTPAPPPDPRPIPPPARAPERAPAVTPARTPLPVSPNFRDVRLSEAQRELGGKVRLLRGMEADHVEIGPAFAVPGAQADLDVVRVVYRAPDGSRIHLDQQLIPADSGGFRPLDDPTLESGETVYGSFPGGISSATWFDEDGYRISLTAILPVDSLKKLAGRVR
jgi:hypothetical protein